MSTELMIAIFGLIGVVVGAAANAAGTRAIAHRKFLQDGQYSAYKLYLNSLSLVAATPPGSDRRWEGVAGMIEAKGQIALFGSRKVVEGLSDFSSRHDKISSSNFDELSEVIAQMRKDCGSEQVLGLSNQLRGLLYGVQHDRIGE